MHIKLAPSTAHRVRASRSGTPRLVSSRLSPHPGSGHARRPGDRRESRPRSRTTHRRRCPEQMPCRCPLCDARAAGRANGIELILMHLVPPAPAAAHDMQKLRKASRPNRKRPKERILMQDPHDKIRSM